MNLEFRYGLMAWVPPYGPCPAHFTLPKGEARCQLWGCLFTTALVSSGSARVGADLAQRSFDLIYD
jgi:hypothetical protein